MDSVQKLFGKKPTPDEMVRKWRANIRAQERTLDRQLRGIEVDEQKVVRQMKQIAKKKDPESVKSCKILARELVRSRRHKDRLHTSKARLNSVRVQLDHQAATIKVSGTLKKSTQVMKAVNQLSRLPELNRAMQEMSLEMTKAGLMDEMIQDTFETLEESDIEEEAEEEVNKVLHEITAGLLGEGGVVGPALEVATQPEEEEEEEMELDEMKARLYALRS